jgi:GT2 family glycosyltransferase/glycosyltransferase involved in cell wall biosynthesis
MTLPTTSRRLVLVAPTLDARSGDAEAQRRVVEFVTRVGEILPDAELVLASFDPSEALEQPNAQVIAADDAGSLIAAAFAADAVLLGPVTLAGDAGARLDDSDLIGAGVSGIRFAAGLACLAAAAHRPFWVVGASVGDLHEAGAHQLVRAVFDLTADATVADPASLAALESLGIGPDRARVEGHQSFEPSPTAMSARLTSPPSADTVALLERLNARARQQLWTRHEELEHEIARRGRAIGARDAVIRQREDDIAALRAAAAQRETEFEQRGLEAIEAELNEIKMSRAWRALDRYRMARARLRAFRATRRQLAEPSRPPMPLESASALRSHRAAKHDVVCLSIIDWDSRWQRPQQIASKFADNGHRVFYVRMSSFLPPGEHAYELTELRENVWGVTVATRMHPRVYEQPIEPTIAGAVADSLAALRSEHDISLAIALVQIPTWQPVAALVRKRFGWRVVYDCMDEWSGFPGIADSVIAEETRLVASADLVVVSAKRLLEKWTGGGPPVVLARNGTDFTRFEHAEPSVELAGIATPVIGYFGAISEWLDIDLLAEVARQRPQYTFAIVGEPEIDVRSLKRLPNVRLLGQRPYDEIPRHLAAFDVCIIPFLVNDITAATDPVKFYEYISAGRPVVSTWMPELDPYRDHLYLARDRDEFLANLDAAVTEDDSARREQRIAVARENDWQARYDAIEGAIAEVLGSLSVVVVTYNNLELNRQCIESVLVNTTQPTFEIIVIDNASTDGTPNYLSECAAADDRVRVVLNDENVGFAAGVNQGLALARGDVLVILNNDTVLPSAWQAPMLRHLERPDVGLVVASTNSSGNESRIPITYTDLDEMEEFAAQRRREHDGRAFDIRVAALYCVGLRRDVLDAIGPLDERFGVGWFEDDDYSHRARLAGYRVICAEDAFVHHVGQAAMQLLPSKDLEALWDENQQKFEEKWSVEWEPHTLRPELTDAGPDRPAD